MGGAINKFYFARFYGKLNDEEKERANNQIYNMFMNKTDYFLVIYELLFFPIANQC